MSSESISTSGLIIALTAGIGGGMLVICALGLLSGYLVRRHWLVKREQSLQQARLQTWYPMANSVNSFSDEIKPKDEVITLYQVPDTQVSTPAALRPGAFVTPPHAALIPPTPQTNTPSKVGPTSSFEDSVHFPKHVSTEAPSSSVSLEMPSLLRSTSQDAVPRTQSFRNKLNLPQSLSPKSSIRQASQRYSRLSQGMLSRLPSHFRSHRSSRRVSLESGESIGMPEKEIPMVRRLTRKEPRFQYDSSSYSSSVGTPEDCCDTPVDGLSTALMPPPPALLKPAESEPNDMLQQRIRAWQESSMNAALPEEDDDVSLVADLPSLSQYRSNRAALRRQDRRSSVHSAGSESVYTQTTMSEVLQPYMSMEPTHLTRIPSIRPQFMAETSLESWLGPEDPQLSHTAQTPESEERGANLFAEVPMVVSTDVEASSAPQRMSQATELSLSLATPSPKALSARVSPYAPRTPSPLGRTASTRAMVPTNSTPSAPVPTTEVQLYLAPMNDTTSQPQMTSYATSNSSRSSFPSSVRFSNEISPKWKHSSHTTVSTEITWVENQSAASKDREADSPRLPEAEVSADPHMPALAPRSMDVKPDSLAQRSISGATSVVAMGYAFDDPSDMDHAIMEDGLVGMPEIEPVRRSLRLSGTEKPIALIEPDPTVQIPSLPARKRRKTTVSESSDTLPPLLPAEEVAQCTTLAQPKLPFSLVEAQQHLCRVDPRFQALFAQMDLKTYEELRDGQVKELNLFRVLTTSILGQQISWLAARSIMYKFCRVFDPTLPLQPDFERLPKEQLPFPTPLQVLDASDESLRGAGLSSAKITYVRDVARRFGDGRLDVRKIVGMDPETCIAELVQVRGVGRWTAEMLLMFALRSPDILPVGDLGVQRGMVRFYLADAATLTVSEQKRKGNYVPIEQVRECPRPPSTVSLDDLRLRAQGKKTARKMYLDPHEMAALAGPWAPFRSVASVRRLSKASGAPVQLQGVDLHGRRPSLVRSPHAKDALLLSRPLRFQLRKLRLQSVMLDLGIVRCLLSFRGFVLQLVEGLLLQLGSSGVRGHAFLQQVGPVLLLPLMFHGLFFSVSSCLTEGRDLMRLFCFTRF
ncbi:DNA-3-methyladenine glycosylase II [Malassezia caprae]|uniref:DNA-3-methyladenine glycosylase II n=1 Tax=Malassezia caprae TaxID=1381934 RepID=A0AAF0EAE7_9BASI|nr:DNA-3-methyladenine glycosylase II [Malassezia caprae]